MAPGFGVHCGCPYRYLELVGSMQAGSQASPSQSSPRATESWGRSTSSFVAWVRCAIPEPYIAPLGNEGTEAPLSSARVRIQ